MSQESEFLKAFYLSQSIKQEILWYIQKTESSTWLGQSLSEETYESIQKKWTQHSEFQAVANFDAK
jgi:hypothetical protein